MKIEDKINDISTNLSILIYQVKLKNKANLNDINTLLETAFKDILNIIYDYNLINLNNKYLYPAIDLGDENAKIAFQVTSERSIQKIKDTIKKFEKNNFEIKYNKLKFLIIDEKVQYSNKHNIDRPYFILKDDIISCFELINIIKDLSMEKQNKINNILKSIIGIKDNISLDVIYDNRNNIQKIENEYTEKIAITKDILSTANLPLELQKYFELQAQIVNNQLKYSLKPSTENAYDLYPIQEKLKMKFNTPKEKEEFINNGGINGLIRKATITRKPVEIPYVTEIKEYLGNYENPFAEINYTENDKVRLYVFPQKLPKGEKYKIIVNDGKEKFYLNTTVLQIVDVQKEHIIFNNFESKNEKFDITLKINILEETIEEEKSYIKYNANINVTLREKNEYSCKDNLELQKFIFTINSSNSILEIYKCKDNSKIFSLKNLGKQKYNDSNYRAFNNYKKLLKKIIYIEKTFKLNIKYNLDYFYKNEMQIDFIYYDSKERNYKLKSPIAASFYMDEYNEKEQNDIITDLPKEIELFNHIFKLKNTKILLSNCKFLKKEIINGKNAITLVSKNAKYIPKWKEN